MAKKKNAAAPPLRPPPGAVYNAPYDDANY